MTITLHAALVPTFRQMLGSVLALIDKAEAFCVDRGIEPEAFLALRLAPDMLPLGYQLKSTAVHSIGAIEGALAGNFSPDQTAPPTDFAAARARLADADARLAAVAPETLEVLAGRPMAFTAGERFRREFDAAEFLLTFSQPNFFFHATMVYAILRREGVEIGKVDFLGAMRLAPAA